jgi:hypothetical protein
MTNTTPQRKASEIGFGIEIECNIPIADRSSFPVGAYHVGAPVQVEGLTNWKTQADGSVRQTGLTYAAEVVSPILYGEDGLQEVVKMLDHLKSISAKVNASCGLHVHVDVSGMNSEKMQRLITLFKKFEMAFYDMNGTHAKARMSNRYCKPSARWDGTRYQSLNLQHIHEARPHIEIRVWHGAMKPETVVAAIYMAVSLVARVTAEEAVQTSDIDNRLPKQVMEKFISRIMYEDTMIVPDYDPHDIWDEMIKAASKTDRV